MRAFSRDRPKPLLGLVRRQKLGIDPALQAGVLDLDPVPLPACSCEPRALGGRAKNGRVSGRCRPDVYAGTLQKDEIPVLRRGGSLGRHSTWSNLGRSLDGEKREEPHRTLREMAQAQYGAGCTGVSDDDCAAIGEDSVVSAGTFAPGEARKKYVSPATPNAAMIAVPAISFRRAPNVSDGFVSYRLFGSRGSKGASGSKNPRPQLRGEKFLRAEDHAQQPSFHLGPEGAPKPRLAGSACPQQSCFRWAVRR